MSDTDETFENDIEISLDSVESLADFAAYVHEQHQDFLRDIETVPDEGAYSLAVKAGTAAYTELTRQLVVAEDLLDRGESLDEAMVDIIQLHYDEFIRVYEMLNEHIAAAPTAVSATNSSQTIDKAGVAEIQLTSQHDSPSDDRTTNKFKDEDMVVTPDFLGNAKHRELIESHFGSVQAFHSSLWRLVRDIERPQKLDNFLGVRHGSIFKHILKDQTVSDIEFFNQQPGEKIREALNTMEYEDGHVYDYRIFNAWMQEFIAIKELFDHVPHMTFGDLVAAALLLPYDSRD